MKSLILLTFALVIISSSACRRTSRTTPPVQPTPLATTPEIIDRPGRYTVNSAGLVLLVYVDEGHIVRYELHDGQGERTLLAGNSGGNFSRWFFHWSPEGELWVYSGDIGTSVWTLDEGGSYKQEFARPENTEIVRRMPNAVFNAAGNAAQKLWSAVRDSKQE